MVKYFRFIILIVLCSCNSSGDNKENSIKKDYYKEYKFEAGQIAVKVPKIWNYEKLAENTLVFKDSCNEKFCTNLVIRLIDNSKNLTMEQIQSSLVESLSQSFEDIDVLGTSEKSFNIGSTKTIDYKVFENETHLGSTIVYWVEGDKIFSLNFMALNQPEGAYAVHRKEFFEIVNELRKY
jgi:hypothetical protein